MFLVLFFEKKIIICIKVKSKFCICEMKMFFMQIKDTGSKLYTCIFCNCVL